MNKTTNIRDDATGQAAAVFDLDGTLLPDTSAEMEFIRFMLATGRLTRPAFLRRLLVWLMYIPWRGGGRNMTHFAGFTTEDMRRFGVRFVREWLLERIPPQAVRTIDSHRSQGDIVGIVSGAPEVLIEGLARWLKLDFVSGTRLEECDGVLTGRVAEGHLSGERKVRTASALASDHAFDLSRSWAYGNAFADRFLLSQVSRPIAVNPDGRLRRFAEERGWPVESYG